MNNKKPVIIIIIIAFAVIFGVTVYFVNGVIRQRNADWYKSTKLINLPIPKN